MIGNEEGPGGSPRQRVEHRLIRACRTPSDPLENRRGTGTTHRPSAPGRNPYRRRRTTELSPCRATLWMTTWTPKGVTVGDDGRLGLDPWQEESIASPA